MVIFSKLYFKHFAVSMKYCKEIVGNNFNTLKKTLGESLNEERARGEQTVQ